MKLTKRDEAALGRLVLKYGLDAVREQAALVPLRKRGRPKHSSDDNDLKLIRDLDTFARIHQLRMKYEAADEKAPLTRAVREIKKAFGLQASEKSIKDYYGDYKELAEEFANTYTFKFDHRSELK